MVTQNIRSLNAQGQNTKTLTASKRQCFKNCLVERKVHVHVHLPQKLYEYFAKGSLKKDI